MARVLCTADVHIGRCSSIGGDGAGVPCTALEALERMVSAAVEGRADAVVVAGDLYDSLTAQYETRSRVRRALERLRGRGIRALAVAGNHDHDALPAFAQSHRGLLHLFPPGRWEAQEVAGVRIVGRSFAREHESRSLLEGYDLPPSGLPTVGVVHADIDADSRYGPTPHAMFAGTGASAWVVGHVHGFRRYAGNVVYPGSPQALDWGETEDHGFCWLDVDGARAELTRCMTSTVLYAHAEVELAADERIEDRLAELAAGHRQRCGELRSVQLRVDLRLPPGEHAGLPEVGAAVPFGAADCYALSSVTRVPDVDLDAESRQADARGQAARLLLGLEGRGEAAWAAAARGLLARVEQSMREQRRRLPLPSCEDVESLRRCDPGEARRAVRRALERVLAAGAGVASPVPDVAPAGAGGLGVDVGVDISVGRAVR